MTKPENMGAAEYRFRCAVYKMQAEGQPSEDYLRRPLAVTSFPGHYGPAGFVVTVNGSPTRAVIVVVGRCQANAAIYALDSGGRARVISKGLGFPLSGPKAELTAAVWDLLRERGMTDTQGDFHSDTWAVSA